MEIKKSATYEFEIDDNGHPLEIEYKVVEEGDSLMRFEYLGVNYNLPSNIIMQLASAIKEISPFDFAFEE